MGLFRGFQPSGFQNTPGFQVYTKPLGGGGKSKIVQINPLAMAFREDVEFVEISKLFLQVKDRKWTLKS